MTKIIRRNSNYDTSFEPVSLNNPHDGYLQEFRNALKQIQPLSIRDEDAYLLRFLRAANFNIAGAVKLVKKNQDLMADNEELLKTPFSQYKHLYGKDICVVLKDRDEEGRKVVLMKARNWNPDETSLDIAVVAVYQMVDEIMESETTQLNGIVIINDISEVGFFKTAKIVSQFTFRQVVRLVNFYQGGYPIKIKAIHIVNTPRIIATTYAGFKYLLKTKMRERIHIHHSGPKVLHKYFKKDILPESLAGSCPENAVEDISVLQNVLRKGNDL